MLRGVKQGDGGQRSEARLGRLLKAAQFALSPVPCPLNSKFWPFVLLLLCLPAPLLAQAPIFPDQIGPYEKHAPTTISAPDRALYDEYGLEASEQAVYMGPATTGPDKKQFTATAWRTHDSTGAMALFQSRRPSGASRAAFAPMAVATSDGVIFEYGNYVIQFTGGQPDNADLPEFYNQLPKFENSPLPLLSKALPADDLVPNSERYLLGPVSPQRFLPEVPPSVAAFRLGAEAQLGKYKTSKGLMTMAIFDYPTPAMARDQAAEFQKITGAAVKRTGPMVAVIPSPPDADAAERLLAQVNYQAQVTLNENTPGHEIKGFARDLISIFVLAGIVILLCIVAGFAYAGFRLLRQKVSKRQDPDAMIVLNIDK